MASTALDRSLAFHRLQEARQELFEARSMSSVLSAGARARMVARCEAALANTEQWLARSSMPQGSPPA
jgi:division protein CdvB (Snf7/Vps24/ESCRT-III family)